MDNFLTGTYKVSLEARTRNGTLNIVLRRERQVRHNRLQTLTTTWKTLTGTYNVTSNQLNRVFEMWESTANNPDWEDQEHLRATHRSRQLHPQQRRWQQ